MITDLQITRNWFLWRNGSFGRENLWHHVPSKLPPQVFPLDLYVFPILELACLFVCILDIFYPAPPMSGIPIQEC